MNVYCLGYSGMMGQISRIKRGFEELGHNISFDEIPDLIYANDIGGWDDAVGLNNFGAKVILNILDLPVHIPVDCERQIEKVKEFSKKYTITCISKFVQRQLFSICGIDCPIVYQPAKDLSNLGLERDIEFLIVGRNNDRGKAHKDITIPVIEAIDGNLNRLHVVGENIGAGYYHGFVSDEKLNNIYNRAKYVFVPSLFDGIGLQLIESVIAGATPISYRWHPAAKEFIEKELVFESINDIICFIQKGGTHKKELYKNYPEKFSGKQIAKNILYVAETTN